ncbi:MAG TPA: hypothetical protein VNA25_20260, partial [Phycisphaerae bacterium]|nr:hypothetical protein [Phycisphaerae bacterium]
MTRYTYAIGGRSDHCGYPLPGVESYRYRLDRGGEAMTNLQMAAAIERKRMNAQQLELTNDEYHSRPEIGNSQIGDF